MKNVSFEKPTLEDGAAMWELVTQSTLDENSVYKYLLMCEFFSETCVIAKEDDKLVGFVTAFIPPEKQDTVFVWQIGVDASQRGKGLGTQLLQILLSRQPQKIKFLEATVTPTNKASQALFKRLAKTFNTKCTISDYFVSDLFPGENHEEEQLFRIGPLY